jgi:hypothetical protein
VDCYPSHSEELPPMTETPTPGGAQSDRRAFLTTAAKAGILVPPAMTLMLSTSMSSSAIAASARGNNGVGNGLDPQPPGNPPINDGPGTSPGSPGNRGGPG